MNHHATQRYMNEQVCAEIAVASDSSFPGSQKVVRIKMSIFKTKILNLKVAFNIHYRQNIKIFVTETYRNTMGYHNKISSCLTENT
jgi:hypothetical protein